MKKKADHELAIHRKAYFNYSIVETYEAGISLMGTEVKSLKSGGASLEEGYVLIEEGQMWLVGVHIALYPCGSMMNHTETRSRRLLMHRREIDKLATAVALKRQTLIPLAFYLKTGKIKVRIALAIGKKLHDKKEALITKEKERAAQQAMKKWV